MFERDGVEPLPLPLEDLMARWVGAWVNPRSGPLYSGNLYRSPVYELLDETRRQAEEPEREAYRQLVSGAATEIARKARSGDTQTGVEELVGNLPHFLTKSDAGALLIDVFTETLDLLTGPPNLPE